jgi:hypothetical protein
MMNASRLELAARNNAIWCDTVCRAHGVPGEFLPAVWLNRNQPPPYHSNLIVLSASSDPAKTIGYIRELIDLPLPGKWSVKDSFATLELEPLGFEVLFEATWIWLDPASREPDRSSPGIQWNRINSPADLADWVTAWSGNTLNSEAVGRPAQFPGSMLEDRQVAFFAGCQGREIAAGGIANRTDGVVGLSNVFVNAGDAQAAWAGLVNRVQLAFPGLPMLGYERSRALEFALACGFEPVGNLRVWIRCG